MVSDIHFMYDQKKDFDAVFAKSLICEFGQAPLAAAQTIVTVGGDGLLLRALRHGVSKNVFGLVSPESNSVGFWTNKDISSSDDLRNALSEAGQYPIRPIKANIHFADGSTTERYGYNEISVKPSDQNVPPDLAEEFGLSSIDSSAQSVLLKVRVHFKDATLDLKPSLGRGLAFASAFGSTAMNKYNGGPAVDIRRESIVLSSMSADGMQPISNDGDVRFTVDVESVDKRPVVVGFDSFVVGVNEAGSPVSKIEISTAQDMASNLMLMDDPATRAYAQLRM